MVLGRIRSILAMNNHSLCRSIAVDGIRAKAAPMLTFYDSEGVEHTTLIFNDNANFYYKKYHSGRKGEVQSLRD